jgi:CHAT domain-containing protein
MAKTPLNRKLLYRLCVITIVLGLWLACGLVTDAQESDKGEKFWLDQGLQQYQQGEFQAAIQLWQRSPAVGNAASPPTASPTTIATLKYLVRAQQQLGQWDLTIAPLKRLQVIYQQRGDRLQLGQIFTETAQVYSALGQQNRAIALLCSPKNPPPISPTAAAELCEADSALAIAQQTQDKPGQIAALGALGNSYRLQGRYEGARTLLEQSLALASAENLSTARIAALQGLGSIYASLAKREYRYAQFARQMGDGQTEQFRQSVSRYDRLAIATFEQSLQLAVDQQDQANQVRARLNLIPLYHRNARIDAPNLSDPSHPPVDLAVELLSLREQIQRLSPSQAKVYALVQLANMTQLTPESDPDWDWTTRCSATPPPPQTLDWLHAAHTLAQQLENPATIALTLGRLGHAYECQRDYTTALQWTQQAQLVGQTQDSRYLWHWQAARIFQAQGKPAAAFAAYKMAVGVLKGIRSDLAIAGRDLQFDFRDSVEPIYREFAALQLNQAAPWPTSESHRDGPLPLAPEPASESASEPASIASESPPSDLVTAALETIDSLHLAELQNYLGDDCTLEAIAKPIALIDQKTAVFSSILLGDRVALILTRPDGPNHVRSQIHWLPVTAQTVTTTANRLRLLLEKRSDLTHSYRQPAQQLYNWLIRPFAKDLQPIDTLVFIQDGILRSIPMATLYDGQQFLIERYAMANTLSLTLVDPTRLDSQNLRVVAFGLTQPALIEGGLAFGGLKDVATEVQQIVAMIPGSTGILDLAFTRDRLQQELQQANTPIIHLATHGKFGIDARDTFLVTGNLVPSTGAPSPTEPRPGSSPPPLYNEKLTMNQLYAMIRKRPPSNPVELLTLTACETAVGSDRDALGIAGISLQAGARSALASLWQIDDQATAVLIANFYQALRQGASRAKALQFAQTQWLQTHPDGHPSYWAALILVGNWL